MTPHSTARLSSVRFLRFVRTFSPWTGWRCRFFTLSARCRISSADGDTRPSTADSGRPPLRPYRSRIASFARRPVSAFLVSRVPFSIHHLIDFDTRARSPLETTYIAHNNIITRSPLARLVELAEGPRSVCTHQMNAYTRSPLLGLTSILL